MYDWKRMERPYREQVEKFIEVAKKDALIKEVAGICCPYRICKNLKVYSDPKAIRSHLIVDGFVKDYYVCTHHGEKDRSGDAGDPTEQGAYEFIVEEENAVDLEEFFDADDYEEQGACDYEGIPSGSLDGMCIDDDADDDNVADLEKMLKHFKADILFGMRKGQSI